MSALDDLKAKPTDQYTALEAAVVFLSGKHPDDAEEAADELETLRFENKSNRRTWEAIAHRLTKLETDLATGDYNKNLEQLAAMRAVVEAARGYVEACEAATSIQDWEALSKTDKEFRKMQAALEQVGK